MDALERDHSIYVEKIMRRCLNCGERLDEVVELNRGIVQENPRGIKRNRQTKSNKPRRFIR